MTDDDNEREREAEWRWGNTDVFRESHRRTSRYTAADWARLQAEAKQILDAMVAAMRRGVAPASQEAMALAELYREHMSRWFYEMSHEMHAAIAEGYVADERFRKTYEDIAPGLARFVSTSIIENARRAGASLSIDDALAQVRGAMGFGAPAPSTSTSTSTAEVDAARTRGARRSRDRR